MQGLSKQETALDASLLDAFTRRERLRHNFDSLQRRRAQLVSAQDDVAAETQALEQNEIAAAAFRNLCGSDNCQFFRQPEESYGRRLLYLKDQLKDFSDSVGQIATEMSQLEAMLAEIEGTIQQLDADRRALAEKGRAQGTIGRIEHLVRESSEITTRLYKIERFRDEQRQFNNLINRWQQATDRVAELTPRSGRREATRVSDARALLATHFQEWVVALATPNVASSITVDERLRIVIGGEVFDSGISYSGSTRTRLVLAFHGAMVETAVALGANQPKLLLLDAPRQNELAAEDVRRFVDRFEGMARRSNSGIQLVLSATESTVVTPGAHTAIWKPQYVVNGEPRFLGPVQEAVGA